MYSCRYLNITKLTLRVCRSGVAITSCILTQLPDTAALIYWEKFQCNRWIVKQQRLSTSRMTLRKYDKKRGCYGRRESPLFKLTSLNTFWSWMAIVSSNCIVNYYRALNMIIYIRCHKIICQCINWADENYSVGLHHQLYIILWTYVWCPSHVPRPVGMRLVMSLIQFSLCSWWSKWSQT
jgi:hypothetical protein